MSELACSVDKVLPNFSQPFLKLGGFKEVRTFVLDQPPLLWISCDIGHYVPWILHVGVKGDDHQTCILWGLVIILPIGAYWQAFTHTECNIVLFLGGRKPLILYGLVYLAGACFIFVAHVGQKIKNLQSFLVDILLISTIWVALNKNIKNKTSVLLYVSPMSFFILLYFSWIFF